MTLFKRNPPPEITVRQHTPEQKRAALQRRMRVLAIVTEHFRPMNLSEITSAAGSEFTGNSVWMILDQLIEQDKLASRFGAEIPLDWDGKKLAADYYATSIHLAAIKRVAIEQTAEQMRNRLWGTM